ncbi:hypothetical protein [Cellulomonas sp. URHD0024]|uniref:hypothetical protein n=1 Tax=Cellulomonas sp. URHD0024 TaxID=1302620 RepID=UPI00041FA4DF|nr:hypothetical protein [Cellulomonas sp. URHD0024]
MSTSDPDRPADDTTPVPVEESAPPVAEPTAAPAAAGAEPAPTVVAEPAAPPIPEPAVADPAAALGAEPAAPVGPSAPSAPAAPSAPVAAPAASPAATEPVSLDTGRHAIVRPVPVPPDDPTPVAATVATPVAAPAATQPAATQPAAAPPAATPPAGTEVDPALAAAAAAAVARGAAPEPGAYGAITPEPDVDGRLFPDPNAPRSPSAGSRILGVIVGLILTPLAVGVLLLGESQILEAQVDGWDASTSVFGIVLVTLGLLLLGCVLLLGLWTAAVPIAGGSLLTAAGAVYLYAPSIARDQTLSFLTSSGWRLTITQVTVAGTSGMVLAAGFLLLLSGLVIASSRRRGIRLGEFRERHKASTT